MCKDGKCADGKKCCGFWKKMFGCKCEKENTCCGGEKKVETPTQAEPEKTETNM